MNEQFNEEAPLLTLYKNYLFSKKLDNSPCILTNQVLYHTIHPELIEIVLNRPEKLNTITFEMTISLLKKVQEWTLSDKAPKLILSTGKGKAYSAGSDVTEYYHSIKTSKILNPDLFR
jgi:enoyl-CoA hydratase/carnithine racemase